MTDIKYQHEVLQTGDLIEGEPCMPGHHETLETPIGCLCCGKLMYYGEAKCVCALAVTWHQNEKRQVTCALHLAEKVKDGEYRV